MEAAVTDKYVILNMTNRAPIRIVAAAWPVIARAQQAEYAPGDVDHEYPPIRASGLVARRHADGRFIVHGSSVVRGIGDDKGNLYAGGTFDAGTDLFAAVRLVAWDCECSHLVHDLIASLPAVDYE